MKRLTAGIVLLSCALVAPTTARADISKLLSALDLGTYSRGEKPPAFDGHTVHGQALSLGDLRGKVVILNFWATWCPPCGAEMALLEDLHRTLGPQDVAVVAVNVREQLPLIREYVEARRLTFVVVVDSRGAIQRSYGVIGLPTTFLIARDGRAVARAIGPRDWAGPQSLELLRTLLREPAPLGLGQP
jgi:thiol-disulfide isomerase/thioredoxin